MNLGLYHVFAGWDQEVALSEVLTLSQEKLVYEEKASNVRGRGNTCFGCRWSGLVLPPLCVGKDGVGPKPRYPTYQNAHGGRFINVCSVKSLFYTSEPGSLLL